MAGNREYLKPKKEGMVIRHPRDKRIIPPEGDWCDMTAPYGRFYRRRIAEGSLVKAKPPSKEQESKPAPKSAEKKSEKGEEGKK